MMKLNLPTFTINVAAKTKREIKSTVNKVSRRCLAVVKEINGELKAIINIDKANIYIKPGDKPTTEELVLPFTEQSLDLKDKIYVFLKDKDEYGHYVCVIRDSHTARVYPGFSTQYNALHENLLLSGYIVYKDGKMYFDYEDLVAFNYKSEFRICEIDIDDTKPIFNK